MTVLLKGSMTLGLGLPGFDTVISDCKKIFEKSLTACDNK